MKHLRSTAARTRLLATGITVVALLAAGGEVAIAAESAPRDIPVTSLPRPFSDWNVTVAPEGDNPQVLTLTFDSPALDRTVVNTVFVPTTYESTGDPWPVLYSLHGTVFPQLDNAALDPVTEHEALLAVTGAGGGHRQTALSAYAQQLDRARFLVVAPDTTLGRPWCETCTWVDPRPDVLPNLQPATAEPVAAETHLHEELYPLVEELFNARTDRGGRGVTGFSMGGWSALIQGFKHPDKYGFVAPVSGVYDAIGDTKVRAFLDANGYLRDQGYGTSLTDETWWRNFNPASLLRNVSGIDQKLLMTVGDACASVESAGSSDCMKAPAPLNPTAALIETLAEMNWETARQELAAKGIPAQFVKSPGVHGANNHRMYADYIVPEANALFSRDVADPKIFSYQAVEKEFSVWGFDISVERPRDEFLTISDASADGREFTLAGSGVADVHTPPTFAPGASYSVTLTTGDTATHSSTVVADSAGRLMVSVPFKYGTPSRPQATVTELHGHSSGTVNVLVENA